MKRTIGIIAFAFVMLATGLYLWFTPEPSAAEYGIIHMPRSGKCPQGFSVAHKVFERKGKAYDGCVSIDSPNGAIDAIYPGESVRVSLDVK